MTKRTALIKRDIFLIWTCSIFSFQWLCFLKKKKHRHACIHIIFLMYPPSILYTVSSLGSFWCPHINLKTLISGPVLELIIKAAVGLLCYPQASATWKNSSSSRVLILIARVQKQKKKSRNAASKSPLCRKSSSEDCRCNTHLHIEIW